MNCYTWKCDDFDLHQLETEWILYNNTNDYVFIMNETAYFILSCFLKDKQIRFANLFDLICKKYNVEQNDIEQIFHDVETVLRIMVEGNLIETI